MTSYDARNAEVQVLTFKEGPLSTRLLKVERFSIKAEGAGFRAEFEPASLMVACSMVDGHEDSGGLMKSLYPDVLRNIKSSVLKISATSG